MNKYEKALGYFTKPHLDCKTCHHYFDHDRSGCKDCALMKNKYKLDEACKKADAFDILVNHCLIIPKDEGLLGYSLQVENKGSHLLGSEITQEEFELLKELIKES